MKTKKYLLICSLILLVAPIKCEGIRAGNRMYPLSVTVLNQSWAFPFSELTRVSPLYPGVTAGICRLRNDKLFYFPQSAYAGYFYNNNSGSALFLYVDQSIRFAPKCGFYMDISLGLGYFHAFQPGKCYKRNDQDRYETVPDWGKPGIMLSMSQTFGFDLSRKFDIPLAPFIRNQWIASSPYFDMVMPIRPSSLVHLGTLIYF